MTPSGLTAAVASLPLSSVCQCWTHQAVLISDKGLAASDRALEGYCQVHY